MRALPAPDRAARDGTDGRPPVARTVEPPVYARPSGRLARLGCTRLGSPGIFGYSGG